MNILLIEDEKELSQVIKKIFELKKYNVECAFDGLNGLEMALDGKYDAIILDIMLPKLNGFEVVKKIREKGNTTPVLILTAKNELDDKVLGLDSGADDYLTKPFQFKELEARIKAIIRRKSNNVSSSTSFADISLDYHMFELIGPSGKVSLTNKEFRIMELLLKENYRIISTELIMEEVWDFDTSAEINVVWAFLSALRKKLQKVGSKCQIIVERGRGYRLGAIEDGQEAEI